MKKSLFLSLAFALMACAPLSLNARFTQCDLMKKEKDRESCLTNRCTWNIHFHARVNACRLKRDKQEYKKCAQKVYDDLHECEAKNR